MYKTKPTVQEMYQRSFQMGDSLITLEIEDTSGMFAYDFPAMVGVSLRSRDSNGISELPLIKLRFLNT